MKTFSLISQNISLLAFMGLEISYFIYNKECPVFIHIMLLATMIDISINRVVDAINENKTP